MSRRPQKISALISDVDGTLVTPDKTLTERTLAAAAAVRARGIAFAVISSRPPRGMRMLIEPLRLTTPLAAFNGGVIVTPQSSVVEQHLLAPEIALKAVEFLSGRGPDVWVFSGENWLLREHGPYVARELRTVRFEPTLVTEFGDALESAGKIVAASADFTLLERCEGELAALLGDNASVSRSQRFYLDVTHPLANKGAGVRALANLMGAPLEEVVVIGDGANDVAMFEQAAFSIAMANGFPETRDRADAVTDSNEQDGFAKAVERYVLG